MIHLNFLLDLNYANISLSLNILAINVNMLTSKAALQYGVQRFHRSRGFYLKKKLVGISNITSKYVMQI